MDRSQGIVPPRVGRSCSQESKSPNQTMFPLSQPLVTQVDPKLWQTSSQLGNGSCAGTHSVQLGRHSPFSQPPTSRFIVQVIPHCPQFSISIERSTQLPPQSSSSGPHVPVSLELSLSPVEDVLSPELESESVPSVVEVSDPSAVVLDPSASSPDPPESPRGSEQIPATHSSPWRHTPMLHSQPRAPGVHIVPAPSSEQPANRPTKHSEMVVAASFNTEVMLAGFYRRPDERR